MHTFRLLALATMICLPSALMAESPFDGSSLLGWKLKEERKSQWKVGQASLDEKDPKKLVLKEGKGDLVNIAPGCDIFTEAAMAIAPSKSSSWCPRARIQAST